MKKINLKNQKGISIVEVLVSLGILGIVFTSVLNYQDLFLKFDTKAEQKVQSKFSQGSLLVSFKNFLFNQDNFCKLIKNPSLDFGVEAIDMYIDKKTLASAFPKTGDTGLGKYLNSNRWELSSDCTNFTDTNSNNLKYCIKPTANNPVSKANLRNLRVQLGLQIVDISPKKNFEKLSSPAEKTDDDAKKDPKTIGFIMIAEFVYDDLNSKKQRAFEKQFKWANEIGSCVVGTGNNQKTVYFSSVSSPKKAVYNNPEFFQSEQIASLFSFDAVKNVARGGEICSSDKSKSCFKQGKCPAGKTCAYSNNRAVRTDFDLLVASACVENTYRKDYKCAFSKNKGDLEWYPVRLEGSLAYNSNSNHYTRVMPFLKLEASHINDSHAVNKNASNFIDNKTEALIGNRLINYSTYTTCQGEGACTDAKKEAEDKQNTYWMGLQRKVANQSDFKINAAPFCNQLCDSLKNPKNLPATVSLGLRIKGHSTYDSSQYNVYSNSDMGCTVCYMKNCRRLGVGTFGKLSEQPLEPLDENTLTCLPKYVKENHAGANKVSLDVAQNSRLVDETRFLERKLAGQIDHNTNYISIRYSQIQPDHRFELERHGFRLFGEQNALNQKLCFQNGRYQKISKEKSCDDLGLVKIEKEYFDNLLKQNPDYVSQNGSFKSSFSSILPSSTVSGTKTSSVPCACAQESENGYCVLAEAGCSQINTNSYARTVDYYVFYNDLKRGIGFLPTMIDAPYLAYKLKPNSADLEKRKALKVKIANQLNELYEDVSPYENPYEKAEIPVKKLTIAPFEASAGDKGALYKQAIFTYVPPALYKEETHPSYSFSYNEHSLPVLVKAPSFPWYVYRDSATQNKTTGLLVGKIGDRKVTIEAKINQDISFPFICKSESGFRLSTGKSKKLHDGFSKCKSHSNNFFIHPTSASEWSEVFDLIENSDLGRRKFAWVNLERKIIKFPDVAEVQDFWSKAFSDDFLNLSAVFDGGINQVNFQVNENPYRFVFKASDLNDGVSGFGANKVGFSSKDHSLSRFKKGNSTYSSGLEKGFSEFLAIYTTPADNIMWFFLEGASSLRSILQNVARKLHVKKLGDSSWQKEFTNTGGSSGFLGLWGDKFPTNDFVFESGEVYEVEFTRQSNYSRPLSLLPSGSYFLDKNKFVFKAANIHKDRHAGYIGFIKGDQTTRVHNYRKNTSIHSHHIMSSNFLGMFTLNRANLSNFYYYTNSQVSRDNIEEIKVRKLGDLNWTSYKTFSLDGNTSGTRWWKGQGQKFAFVEGEAYEVEIVKTVDAQRQSYLTRVKDLFLQYQSKKYKNEINVTEGSNTLERYYLKCRKNDPDPVKSNYQNQAYFLMANETVSRDVKKATNYFKKRINFLINFGNNGEALDTLSGFYDFYGTAKNNPISFLGNGNIKGGFTSPLEVLLSPYIQEERIVASKKPFSYSGTLSHSGTGLLASKYVPKSCSN